MADTADNQKYTVDDITRLAAEVDDPRLVDALADAATVLRGLSADDKLDRDKLIHEMADRHYGAFWSYRAKAAEMDRGARRYQASARWREQHHDCLRLPAELRGTPEEYVWRVLKATEKFPGADRLRKILANR